MALSPEMPMVGNIGDFGPEQAVELLEACARERNPKRHNTFSRKSRLESRDQRVWKVQR